MSSGLLDRVVRLAYLAIRELKGQRVLTGLRADWNNHPDDQRSSVVVENLYPRTDLAASDLGIAEEAGAWDREQYSLARHHKAADLARVETLGGRRTRRAGRRCDGCGGGSRNSRGSRSGSSTPPTTTGGRD